MTILLAPRTRAEPRRLPDVKTALAGVGLSLYALLRVAYVHYYGPLGLSPDDLGLGYLDLLAQAAVGAILVALAAALLLIGAAAVIHAYFGFGIAFQALHRSVLMDRRRGPRLDGGYEQRRILEQWRTRMRNEMTRSPAWVRGREVPITGGALVIGLVIAGLVLSHAAHVDAEAVKQGRSRSNVTFLGIPITSWKAEAATLSWTAKDVDPALRPLAGRCVMYIGQANGTIFVYSPTTPGPATFRVPAATAVMRIDPDGDCRTGPPRGQAP